MVSSWIKTIDSLQNLPAPQGDRITSLKIANPINHRLYSLGNLSFEAWSTELRADRPEHVIMLRHMYNDKNTEEVLGPAEEIRYQSFMPRSWRERQWPL